MFLFKNCTPIRPKILLRAETLLNDAVRAVLRLSHSDAKSEEKCFKYRPSKKAGSDSSCRPVKVHVPPYYQQLDPCKTDKQLALQHPRNLGVYPRCDVPFKPEYDCMDPCLMAVRLDDTMYKPSASLDRKFEQYWVDCFVRKQKRCCRKVPPERSVRTARVCGSKANAKPCKTVHPMSCKSDLPPPRCPRFQLCNCPSVESAQVNCRLAPRVKRCRRRPCLYPSFSECQHEELDVGRPVECRCLDTPPMCIVYRYEALGRRGVCDKRKDSKDDCK
ncbi:hypothetical protein KR038_000392 [Drosophila bunnanda]|nr:hypothetical protein KR038_000392 [Drosophila bunnanda]